MCETAGRDDEAACESSFCEELLDEEAGHYGFASTGIVSKEEVYRMKVQHAAIDSVDLVGQRLNV